MSQFFEADIDQADPFADEAEHDTTTDTESSPKAKTRSSGATKANRAHADRVRKATIKEAIAKTMEILDAPESQREIAASILGCGSAPDTLAEQILTTRKGATRAVDDLLAVADAEDALEAGIAASALAEDKGRLAAAWSLAQTLDLISPGSAPASGAKAAAAFGRAALQMTQEHRDRLNDTISLLG